MERPSLFRANRMSGRTYWKQFQRVSSLGLTRYVQVAIPHPPLSRPQWLYEGRAKSARRFHQAYFSCYLRVLIVSQLEAEFSLKDPKQHVTPTQLTWAPFDIPSGNEKVNFVQGLKTMMGNGGPMLREGLAVHVYVCNADMGKTAFVNSDGDFLIVPSTGRLDIQTEMGKSVLISRCQHFQLQC